ncbi:MAG: nitronate monooxygenase [Bacteroidetes bacterium]|nr:nitronate monooxygenase [Bacteroidota bacterium]
MKNLTLPVIAAPMFLISQPKLVIECCRNGIIGTLPSLNNRTTAGFEEWVIEIKAALATIEQETGKTPPPYGVNLIVHGSNPRAMDDLKICIKHQVPIVITSLGAVKELVDAVHSYGGKVYHDITNLRHAKSAARAGVDGLIAVAGGAGGHAGTTNPFALMQEIKSFYDGEVILAGCISTGRDVAAALQMGADYAYMGTRFINTTESNAQEEYKEMIIEAGSKDIIHTPAVSGVPASFMKQSLEQAGFDMAKITNPGEVNFGEKLKPVDDEAKAWKTVWSAGQGVAAIDDVLSVKELVTRLKDEFKSAVEDQKERTAEFL